MATVNRRILPGFLPGMSYTLTYLTILVLVPLGACFFKAMTLSWDQFWGAVWTPRAQAAYALTFGASLAAAVLSTVFGLVVAWVLVRYQFPGKRLFDSLIDLPFALPTAVAGLVYRSLYVKNGWLGQFLVPLGIELALTRSGIVWVLTFLGIPFIVRTVQPVLEALESDQEEAAASLGANRFQTVCRVILPNLYPAIVTGFALAFARCLGEYGSVVFIAGNKQFDTEIAPILIVNRLEETEYGEAAAIAIVLLVMSFAMLIVINWLERWSRRNEH
ncbi:MAG: sulfate ABC transporter permease subunit CysT [Gemmataceae bacterium]|nr:sulfate ABC transporter permease subunit CysT [Gemmataceae bacterium]